MPKVFIDIISNITLSQQDKFNLICKKLQFVHLKLGPENIIANKDSFNKPAHGYLELADLLVTNHPLKVHESFNVTLLNGLSQNFVTNSIPRSVDLKTNYGGLITKIIEKNHFLVDHSIVNDLLFVKSMYFKNQNKDGFAINLSGKNPEIYLDSSGIINYGYIDTITQLKGENYLACRNFDQMLKNYEKYYNSLTKLDSLGITETVDNILQADSVNYSDLKFADEQLYHFVEYFTICL